MTTLNDVTILPQVRQPRGTVKIGGVVIPAWFSWSVDNNSFYSADTFRVSFAVKALPPDYSPDWFSQQKTLEVEILAGFPADPANPLDAEMHSLIIGHVDDVEFNPSTGVLEISGRDLSAHLIDNKTAPEAYRNQTASDIADKLAAKYGLTPQITKTTTRVGTYWDQDHVGLQDQRSEYDLLAYLAAQEGFTLLVKGRTLFFGPSPFLEEQKAFFVLDWNTDEGRPRFNGKNLSFKRALTIAKGVTVTASSYQTKHKKKLTAVYPRATRGITPGRAKAIGAAQNYVLRLPPNKSVLELEQAAHKRFDEIVAHEMHLGGSMPADHSLDIKTAIKVQGTGTAYDQIYYPDSIVWNMNMDSGYTMDIRAKNSAPENTPNL